MIATVSQQTVFSASHQLDDNGREARQHGHNYSLWASLSGQVDEVTGVIAAHRAMRNSLESAVAPFDHRDLNTALADRSATAAGLAEALWQALAQTAPTGAELDQLELHEEGGRGVRQSRRGQQFVQAGMFSAAHRTHAPGLSEAENLARYGICNNPAGHGHNYRVEIASENPEPLEPTPWAALDHSNLSQDIAGLRGRNVVTETIAEWLAARAPVAASVRLWETPEFFAEYRAGAGFALGRRYTFHAAHDVHNPAWSADENRRLYDKCGLPGGHGHTYGVEVVVTSPLDPVTETAFDLGELDALAGQVLAAYDYANLDAAELVRRPSSGENVAAELWQRFERRLGPALASLVVEETRDRRYKITRGVNG